MSHLTLAAVKIPAAIHYTPQPPPGSAKIIDVINWVSWTFGAAAIVGFIGVGITLILAFNDRGPGSGHVQGLMRVLLGCIIGAAAGGLAGWATS